MTVVTVLFAVGATTLLIALLALRALRQGQAQAVALGLHLLGGYDPTISDTAAVCFGVQRPGQGRVTGRGYLAASIDRIAFVSWLPRRRVTILRMLLVEVATTRTHQGRRAEHDLLYLRWIAEDGSNQDGAFAVTDLGAWLDALGARPSPS